MMIGRFIFDSETPFYDRVGTGSVGPIQNSAELKRIIEISYFLYGDAKGDGKGNGLYKSVGEILGNILS